MGAGGGKNGIAIEDDKDATSKYRTKGRNSISQIITPDLLPPNRIQWLCMNTCQDPVLEQVRSSDTKTLEPFESAAISVRPPAVTPYGLAHTLSGIKPAVYVFITWMLPLEDTELEKLRQEAIASTGKDEDELLCCLPDEMEDFETARRNPEGGYVGQSWVTMKGKESYAELKKELETQEWTTSMQSTVNGHIRRLLTGSPAEDFLTTLHPCGKLEPRECLQRWTLATLHVEVDDEGFAKGLTTKWGKVRAEFLRCAACVVVQGVWSSTVRSPALARLVERMHLRERLCFHYVETPFSLFSLDGECLYQNPASIEMHGDLVDFAADGDEINNTMLKVVWAGELALFNEMKKSMTDGYGEYRCEVESDKNVLASSYSDKRLLKGQGGPRGRSCTHRKIYCFASKDPSTQKVCIVVRENDISNEKHLEAKLLKNVPD